MKRAAAAAAVLACTLAAAPLATPEPSPGPLREIAAVRARAFCGLSKDDSVKSLMALLDTEKALGDGVMRMAKANTANTGSMHLMVNSVQDRVHRALQNITSVDEKLKKLEGLAKTAQDTATRDAALAVIATLRHDRDVENELMNRMNDYAETYLMNDMIAGDETESQMRDMLDESRERGALPTPSANSMELPTGILRMRNPVTGELLTQYEREQILEQTLENMTSHTVDVSKASLVDLRKATIQAAVATDGLLAVCNAK